MGDASAVARKPLEYSVGISRVDGHSSLARCKSAEIVLDTDPAGRADAFNPAELLLASLAACLMKGIERVTPMLGFDLRGVEITVHGTRQDAPPKMIGIGYEIVVDTDEPEHRLDLLHRNARKYGTISNTLAEAVPLTGTMRRAQPSAEG
ncbi:MAG TPA: OsmC family protein [Devosiaceae bacterium]